MSFAIDKEQAVAGFINRNSDGMEFMLDDVYDYVTSLWNAGCGPIRFNFKRNELINYLKSCENICLRITPKGYKIDKSFLSNDMTQEEKEFLHDNEELAKSFDLFCKLQVDIKTPSRILDAMGYRFIYA